MKYLKTETDAGWYWGFNKDFIFSATGSVTRYDSIATVPDSSRGVHWSANSEFIYTAANTASGGNYLAVYGFDKTAVPSSDALAFNNFPASQPTGSGNSASTDDRLFLAIAEADTTVKVYTCAGSALALAGTQPPTTTGNMSDVAWSGA